MEVSKGKVDTFKRTMPLITDLKNKAMRNRHWNQIKVGAIAFPIMYIRLGRTRTRIVYVSFAADI